jgi:hypothetical protein
MNLAAEGLRKHDPVQQLNDHHRDQLLAVARAFGDHPDAVDAAATRVDDQGIELLITLPAGQVRRFVAFAAGGQPSTNGRRRAFHALAQRATERLASPNHARSSVNPR